jgi:heat shock protein HslJ/uncharacterized protein YraI
MLHITQQHLTTKLMLAFLLVFSLLLGACGGPAPAPTEAPIPEPTSVPEPVLETLSQAELVGETWQWIGLRETMPAAQSVVPDPENYTLTFNEDGTVSIKADCNVAMGSYQLSGDQLTISMGPTTLAECGPESSYSQFLSLLEQAAGVGMGYGNLVITLANEAGEMIFQRATTSSLAASLEPIAEGDLVDTLWQWVSLIESMPASQSMVPDAENYNLVFRADGTYSAKADCNQLLGSYELLGSQLKLQPGISTLAECGPDSSYDLYSSLLERVVGAGTREGVLVLVLAEDAGIMNFQNAGEAPQAVEPPPAEGELSTLLGPPSGMDSFDNKNNWTLFDSPCFSTDITGGQFVMTANGQQGFYCWEVSWPLLQNAYIETTVNMPEACDPQDQFGLLVRAPDNYRGYLYGLDCAGNYSLSLWDGNKTTTLIEPTQSEAILKEPDAVNRIGIETFDERFYLFANGVFLGQAEDFTYLEAGKIGYFVRAATQNPFTVAYDDLKVWALDDEFFPSQVTPPAVPPAQIEPPEANTPTVTATTNLNVRSGPSMQFPVLGAVPPGTTGQLVGTSPDGYWWAVRVPTTWVGTGQGWVAARYTTLTNPANAEIPVVQPPLLPPVVTVPVPPAGAPQLTIIESAVIRSGPSPEYPVYGVTPVGVKAEVTGKSEDGNWWVIRLPKSTTPDEQGWVYGGYAKAKNVDKVPKVKAPKLPKNVTPAVPDSGAPAAITIEPVNVRSGPGNAYTSYGKVPIGTIMAVIGVSPDGESWVIRLPTDIAKDGQGWVPVRYTQAQNTKNVNVIQPPPLP